MIILDTPSNGHASTYQISLTFLKRQTSYGPDKFYQLFDLRVKGQGQMNVMIVCDTPSSGHAPTHKISFTNLERQRNYGLDNIH